MKLKINLFPKKENLKLRFNLDQYLIKENLEQAAQRMDSEQFIQACDVYFMASDIKSRTHKPKEEIERIRREQYVYTKAKITHTLLSINNDRWIFNERLTSILMNWLISRFIQGKLYLEDLGIDSKASEYFIEFYKYNSRFKGEQTPKDINKYPNLAEIYKAYKPYKDLEKMKHGMGDPRKIKDSILVLENDEFLVMSPLTEEASCELGKDTEWCTAKYKPGDERNAFNSYTKSKNNFYQHTANRYGPLYIFFDKKSGGKRYQYHIQSNQAMDEDDNEVNDKLESVFKDLLFSILTKKPELKSQWINDDQIIKIRNLMFQNNIPLDEQEDIYRKYIEFCEYYWKQWINKNGNVASQETMLLSIHDALNAIVFFIKNMKKQSPFET